MTSSVSGKLFEFENNQLAFRRLGHGKSMLLAFHGFGQTGQVFTELEKTLGERYTILAVDLFFHGGSRYEASQLLTKSYWQKMLNAFLNSEHVDQFSLLGFSMGGRFALVTAECFSDRVDELFLIAPDGVTRSIWYELATTTSAGRWLFQYVLAHLSVLSTVGHLLTRLGLLNRTVMRFAELSLGTSDQRDLVYKSWIQFRFIRPDLKRISQLLNQQAIAVHFFIGAFDRIIPGRYILPLTRGLSQYQLTVLRTGHNRLIELTGAKLSTP